MSDDDYDAHVRAGEPIGDDRYVMRTYWTPDEQGISLPAGREPEEGWVLVGITESHRSETEGKDEWCGGYVLFSNVPESALYAAKFHGPANHVLDSAHPLTISPSLACRRCPSHGYIKRGQWSEA